MKHFYQELPSFIAPNVENIKKSVSPNIENKLIKPLLENKEGEVEYYGFDKLPKVTLIRRDAGTEFVKMSFIMSLMEFISLNDDLKILVINNGEKNNLDNLKELVLSAHEFADNNPNFNDLKNLKIESFYDNLDLFNSITTSYIRFSYSIDYIETVNSASDYDIVVVLNSEKLSWNDINKVHARALNNNKSPKYIYFHKGMIVYNKSNPFSYIFYDSCIDKRIDECILDTCPDLFFNSTDKTEANFPATFSRLIQDAWVKYK